MKRNILAGERHNEEQRRLWCTAWITSLFLHTDHITGYPRLRMMKTGLILLFLIPSFSAAQSISRAGTTAAPFLKIAVGARAMAMGEAYTTQAEDVTGLFWNPAGLSRLEGIQILLNHYEYVADLYYEFGGIGIPIRGVGTIGLFLSYLGMPDIERTTIQFPDGSGEQVSANSYSFGLSYSRALTDRFSIGGNAKLIKETLWHSRATGVAFDLGLQYRTFFRNLRIGMCISNFGGDMRLSGRDLLVQHDIDPSFAGNNQNINSYLDTDQFPLPVLFRVGLSANLARDFLGIEKHDFIFSVDAVHPNDNREHLNIGSELRLYDMIALRAGFRNLFLEDREGGLTFGFGLHLKLLQYRLFLDYANIDFGRLDHANKFSLILSL